MAKTNHILNMNTKEEGEDFQQTTTMPENAGEIPISLISQNKNNATGVEYEQRRGHSKAHNIDYINTIEKQNKQNHKNTQQVVTPVDA